MLLQSNKDKQAGQSFKKEIVAIMGWATRKVLSWRLSNTMHAEFCIEALNEAIAKHGPPKIIIPIKDRSSRDRPGSRR